MSERFKSQDYFRYKKLGKRWRRPTGLQSKMKIRKGGSGLVPSIGYGSPASTKGRIRGLEYVMVNNVNELHAAKGKAALIAGGVGRRKTQLISEKAAEMGVIIINRNKVKDAKRFATALEKHRTEKKTKKKEEAKVETKAESKGEEKTEAKDQNREDHKKEEHKHDHGHE